ncbi:hypothetical protein PIB30_072448 [Stylosanthes scabra]|uniref:Aminotransferase-like plant mobile domain-containing protein n=1 Tax=Stylosanthes scabra TaxID=79078 RepID=A0ABU6VPC1_9FABA|nr:hypothetical protein [Stylosanthes scabra]
MNALVSQRSGAAYSCRWSGELLEDFDTCTKLSWGSTTLCYTYHCLCCAIGRATTDLAGCALLMMSWICQRFPRWCPDARNAVAFLLTSRDMHEIQMVSTKLNLDRLGVNEAWMKRQLGGEQPIPEDPVNLDGFLEVSTRGEDQWWPTKHED